MQAARPANAATWFRRLTGADYPTPAALAGLRPVRRNVWASHVTAETQVEGLPHFMAVRPLPDPPATWRVLGFAGRGVNRQAIYYTVGDPHSDLRLRLPFGGLLMDPVERQEAVCADLRFAEWIHDQLAGRPLHCTLRFGLADREIRVVSTTGRRRKLYESFWPRLGFSHQAAQAALEEVLGAHPAPMVEGGAPK